MTRPSRADVTAHRRWVIDCIREAASRLGKSVAELRREAFAACAGESDWPINRDFEALGGWAAARNAAAIGDDPPPTSELGAQRQTRQETLYVRRLERGIGDRELTVRLLRETLSEAVRETPPVITAIDKAPIDKALPSECETVAFISDVHFGSIVDPEEVPGNAYDWEIAARRMAFFAKQIAEYKPHHRDRSRLRLLLGGDIIENQLHGSGPHIAPLAEQLDGARQILTDLINYLRAHYPAIHVECASGNHDRHSHQHQRSTAMKWDGLGTVLYRGLEAIFAGCDDVTWSIPRTPYTVWRAPGDAHCALSHGDTVFNVGTPGKRVDVAKLGGQLRAWNAARRHEERLEVLAVGHYHTALTTAMDDGSMLVVNGCGSGTAGYAQSIGIHGSCPIQLLWESVPGHAVGDVRFVRLAQADADESLHRIVPIPTRIGSAA